MSVLKCTCGNAIKRYQSQCNNCRQKITWGDNPGGYYYKIDGQIFYYKDLSLGT